MNDFLPICKDDLVKRNISQLDFICVTGDAYVDHPSFGIAIISRVLESEGYSVGVIAQPQNDRDFLALGTPKYGFMVTSGNIDSMVSNYTVAKKRRNDDAYSAGNIGGRRPDRALTVYCNYIRKLFADIPIVIGGLEASLRRFAHYDYWVDEVMPSILIDTKADILIYGMGEYQTKEVARRLSDGVKPCAITDVRGTCFLTNPENTPLKSVQCANFDVVKTNKQAYAKSTLKQLSEQDEVYGKTIIQRHGNTMLVQNPPMTAVTKEDFDKTYELPYMRTYHPIYEKQGGVPAILEVEFSVIHNRGCFGGCNFCSIALHQGRKISSRSADSVLKEAEKLTENPNFKGYIHDVGGPTANFRDPSCEKQLSEGLCKNRKCLAPKPCPQIKVSHDEYLDLLRRIRKIKKVKKVFIRSGIRYDYLLLDKNKQFLRELIEHHVSGQLKVAPEHCSEAVLDNMGKSHIDVYESFSKQFYEITKSINKEQFLVPYLMSSHPGCTLKDSIELAVFLKQHNIRPEQVQDFYPTPGTISTAMFYSEINPYTMEKIYVPKTSDEKAMQRALLQYFAPKNKALVIKALRKAGRFDLIGNKKDCLVAGDPKQRVHRKQHHKKTQRNKEKTTWQKDGKKRRGS